MIDIKNISKWYGSFQVLTDCSTEVRKGEVIVVCGPSGSGKSTLIKTVNGLEPIQQGEIFVDGVPLSVSEETLATFFSMCGAVFAVRLTPPAPSGDSRRAWVEFEALEVAYHLLELRFGFARETND